MTVEPLVSIIIPTYNHAHLIGETLSSVLSQSYTNWECIVVDDGSTDGTAAVMAGYCEKDSRLQYFKRPKNLPKGSSSCRNYGLDISNGKFVIFLDSDDLLATFCLENRLVFTLEYPNYELWIFPMQSFIGTLENKRHKYGYFEIEQPRSYFIERFYYGEHPFQTTCSFWLKETLLQLNGFNENLRIYTDPDLHLRMLTQGFDFKLAIQYPVDCYYRLFENYKTKHNYKTILKNNLVFFDKHLNPEYLESVKYFKKVISKYIFKHKSFFYLFEYINLGIRKGVVPKRIYITSLILMFYHIIGIHNFSGFGYHKLKKRFNLNFKV